MGQTIYIKIKHHYYRWLLVFNDIKKYMDQLLVSLSSLSCITIVSLLLLEFAFTISGQNIWLYYKIHTYLLYFFIGDICFRLLFLTKKRWRFFLLRPTDSLAFLPILSFLPSLGGEISFFSTQIALLLVLIGRISHIKVLLNWLKIRPAQMIILAFLFVIFIGSLLLSLPITSVNKIPMTYIDALFTSCSAVCVTGLVVNDIGTELSIYGQIIILFLIQIGGLGIMSFSVLIAMILRRKLSQVDSMQLQENYATVHLKETFSAIGFIFKFTLFFELIGTGLLALAWKTDTISWGKTLYSAMFHSISAFCNAGFSLFSDSLIRYQTHFPTILIISSLIIFGGLGFPVLFNAYQRYILLKSNHIKLQTRLAIQVTLVLIILGTLIIYFTEQHTSLQGIKFWDQLQIAYFQSVTARTAGFNTIDISMFHSSTIMVLMILMIIGASPGSTGGGIKTTTFGLIMISLFNTLQASFRCDYHRRTIELQSIIKAFSTLFIAVLLIAIFLFGLIYVDSASIKALLFEVISAFGTVGLSLGITPSLTNISKIMIISLMFIGRIGPLTFLYAFVKQQPPKPAAFPIEKVSIV